MSGGRVSSVRKILRCQACEGSSAELARHGNCVVSADRISDFSMVPYGDLA